MLLPLAKLLHMLYSSALLCPECSFALRHAPVAAGYKIDSKLSGQSEALEGTQSKDPKTHTEAPGHFTNFGWQQLSHAAYTAFLLVYLLVPPHCFPVACRVPVTEKVQAFALLGVANLASMLGYSLLWALVATSLK
eukprot:scaffold29352_cov21-Tisochrysis_lutea.AAC.4